MARVFLRGVESAQYGLREQRARRLAAPRVVRAGTRQFLHNPVGESEHAQSDTQWLLGPGDEPFLTQSLQSHYVRIYPGGANGGHGHQNEALFYILAGRGYEIHDGRRYDWEQGDVVGVHADSVTSTSTPTRTTPPCCSARRTASTATSATTASTTSKRRPSTRTPPATSARWTPSIRASSSRGGHPVREPIRI